MTQIDIAGIKYDLEKTKGRHFLYRSSRDFEKDFKGIHIPNVTFNQMKHILTKYMSATLYKSEQKQMLEMDDEERKLLIKILTQRAKILLNSIKSKNTIVTTIPLRKSHTELLEFIRDITKYTSVKKPSADIINSIHRIIQLDRDSLIEFVLELSWLLLNPDDTYTTIKDFWKKKIENLDNIKLQDIIYMVKKTGLTPAKMPKNHFKNMNKLSPKNEKYKDIMKTRIEILLNIMVLQRYYDFGMNAKDEDEDEEEYEDEGDEEEEGEGEEEGDEEEGEGLYDEKEENEYEENDEKEEEENEKRKRKRSGGNRGAMNVFNKPLGNVMSPIFEYFKVLYDPVYSSIDTIIRSYTDNMDSHTIEKIIIPSLLTIHHICNNIKKDGTYRIINMNDDVITFINNIIKHTELDNKAFQLPKVYLSTLLHKSNVYTYPDTLEYVQIFTVGNNLNVNSTRYKATSFFNNKNLYIIKSKEEIPFDLYEIDFNGVDMYSPTIKNKKLNNKYVNTKTPEKMSDVISIRNNFNNSQLTLSIFIAFKELMSK